VTTFGSIATSISIAVGNTVEAAVTALLIEKLSSRDEPFATPSRVATFAALTLAPGTVISATVGVGSLIWAGFADAAKFAEIWLTWWLGDVGGQLLVAPVLFLWARSIPLRLVHEEAQELAGLLAATITVGLIAFSPLLEQTATRSALAFLAIGPMLWAALRQGQRNTAMAALVLASFAIWGTLANGGPFARPNLNDSFLLVVMFVISTAVPSLVLSADVAVRKEAQARQRLLVRELQHRTKNLIAVAQSIVSSSLARSQNVESATEAIRGRLQALARSQDHTALDLGGGIAIHDLVAAELAPFVSRTTIDGPDIVIRNSFGQKLALVLHELATNSAKYGSLSVAAGLVIVKWRMEAQPTEEDSHFKLLWLERDGPPVAAPNKHGFGMQLIAMLLDNKPRIFFEHRGLEFEINVQLSEVLDNSQVS
jgi:two-component sensor histidine kinase